MAGQGEKLLAKARQSIAGWRRAELDRLYGAFGFIIRAGSKHDIVKHPDFPELRSTVTRSSDLAKGYVQEAIKLIEKLQTLKAQRGEQNEKPKEGS